MISQTKEQKTINALLVAGLLAAGGFYYRQPLRNYVQTPAYRTAALQQLSTWGYRNVTGISMRFTPQPQHLRELHCDETDTKFVLAAHAVSVDGESGKVSVCLQNPSALGIIIFERGQ